MFTQGEGQLYSVTQQSGMILVVLHGPARIIRCSVRDLFEQLRPYQPKTDDWVDDSGALKAEFVADPRSNRAYLIAAAISAAFTPRSLSRAWKSL